MKSLLTLVEGEGSLVIIERDGYVERVLYEITEAPRFFEQIIRDMSPEIVVDTVSRICGLCGVSYAFLAAKAFEKCLGVEVDANIDRFREILHLAERVKSHVLHVFFMNLPEITGARSLSELAERNPQILGRALRLLSFARKLMSVLGGRPHNVVNVRIGGVYSLPSRESVGKLLGEFREALSALHDLADIVLSSKPSLEIAVRVQELCVHSDHGYPHYGERLVLGNTVYPARALYENVIKPVRREYSTALHYKLNGTVSYITGPVARFNKYYTRLRGEVRDLLETYGWRPPLSVLEGFVARFAEIHDSLLAIQEYLENYKHATITSTKTTTPRVSSGFTCDYAVEAPRGVLYHRYVIGGNSRVLECSIVTPTAQNLAAMEDIATQLTHDRPLSEEVVKLARNVAIALDPCISCATHTLKVKIVNTGNQKTG